MEKKIIGATIFAKLVNVQNELKAPKGQYNKFGKYNYRSCEDILEAVKPLLKKSGLTLFIHDDIELVGERYYIKATCTLIDNENGEKVEISALARESKEKKGMDSSQVTGTASSYARKYALNGLFLIDDTKDTDTNSYATESDARAKEVDRLEKKEFAKLCAIAEDLGFSEKNVRAAIKSYGKQQAIDLEATEKQELVDRMKLAAKKKAEGTEKEETGKEETEETEGEA